MSFRLPQSLAAEPSLSLSPLEREVVAERAEALAFAGRQVEKRLRELAAHHGSADAGDALVQAAAEAVHALLIQREHCGFLQTDATLRDYAVPPEVAARIGVRHRAPNP